MTRRATSVFTDCTMTSPFNTITRLSAVLLGLSALCVSGGPVGFTESPSGEAPDAKWPLPLLSASPVLEAFIGVTKLHETQFAEEFHEGIKYFFLDNYRISLPPAGCPAANFSMESCLLRLAQGLLHYKVLLKHVDNEYPNNPILPDARHYSGLLLSQIKERVKHPERAAEMSLAQEKSLLSELRSPDTFHRKVEAHCILRHLHLFLIDGKRALARKEMQKRDPRYHSI